MSNRGFRFEVGVCSSVNHFCLCSGSEDLHLEKAYCHYRLNNLQEARRILESVPSRTSAQNELLGQVVSQVTRRLPQLLVTWCFMCIAQLYRLEEYGSSLSLYRDLMRHTQVAESLDLDAFITSACLPVCLSVCLSVCL